MPCFDRSDPLHAIASARLARTCLALAVGAALGLAGALMQGLTRNPLADPGILGVNAGASFAMVLAMSVLGVSSLSAYMWFAFAGAALTMGAVHAIASLGRDGATPLKLVIAGAALTAALTSWTTGVLLTDRQTMETFRFWQVGTVGGRGLDVLATGAPFLFVGALIALVGARLLNALALGDDVARGLGVDVIRRPSARRPGRRAAGRRRHGAGRTDRLRRADGPARGARLVGRRPPAGAAAGSGRSAPSWSRWPTPSAGCCCRRPRCRSGS